jgi:protein-tyrosine-phosphatase/predicted ATP-grasp superfamily ATP-dependent carboligase
MASQPKVLIIGDDTRSFLACVRSLGRQGIEVHAAPYTLDAPALQSRYIRKVHLLPYYLDGGDKWLTAMQDLLNAEQFDMVLPCEERGLLPLYVHQAALPPRTRLAIPDAAALDAFFDKVNTRDLATRCGVPVPTGQVWQQGSSIAQLQSALGFPMVVKYRQSYSLPDLYLRTQVRMLDTPADVLQWIDRHQPAPNTVYFEQVVPGIGLGVSVLCHQGQVLQAFEHHRANELSGSSYYRKSMPLVAARLDAVKRMAAAISYTGLAMFEFKLDTHTGNWVLLEVNGRPWGSLPLPVAWGVDFPYRLYQLLCLQQVTAPVPYPTGRFNRNLIGDIWQMRLRVSQLAGQPVQLVVALLRWLAGFGRILILRERQDALVLDDPQPAWAEITQFVRQRLPQPRTPDQVTGKDNAALTKLLPRKPLKLLFLCQGNICRSPYAAYKARSIFDSVKLNISVDSAGMLPRNARPSPPQALAAAQATHIDLAPHLSQCADAGLVADADVILIFDDINYRSFKQRHPEQVDKLLFLSAFAPGDAANQCIADPDGKDVATFKRTYSAIDSCLHNLAQQLKSC